MGQTVTNYLLLILVITCSFLSIHTFDFYPSGPYDKSLDIFRLIAPGVLFSLYIVTLQRRNWAIWKLILFYFILLILYYTSLMASLSSWGIGVPFAGGIGALLIKKLFYQKTELLNSDGTVYLSLGFIAGLGGLCLYYALNDIWTDGVGFGFILVMWQLVFGLLWIRQIDSTQEKTIDN